jgi:hypothetical protein
LRKIRLLRLNSNKRAPSRWATRESSYKRKKKTRRWRKPASGSSRTASFAGIISTFSQKLEEIKDTASREAFLDAVAHGSAVAWQHLNLLGEYDFSDEKLRDSIGIRPQKLVD